MPTVTFSKKTVLKLIGKKLSDDKLKDRISMFGTDLEHIEGDQIVVEIFPNRPDLLSEQGFARGLASFIESKPGLRKYSTKKGPTDYKVIIDKSVSKVRPYTACAIVKGIKFSDERIREIIQVQEKLHISYGRNRKKCAIGIYPLEKIKLPIHYTAKDPKEIKFQPLESPKEMTGLQILSQHPTGREYGHLLEGKDLFPFFIDSAGNVLSMPPIINSEMTGRITETTKDVFIECSGFDYDVLAKCLNMIVTSLADMDGEVYTMQLESEKGNLVSPDLSAEKMEVDTDYINRILGLDLKDKDFKRYFEMMGYSYRNKEVHIPCYRVDILHQIDLAEDVAIAYGYENFEETIPNITTTGAEAPFEIFKDKIADMLANFGLIETMGYHLSNKEVQCRRMQIDIPVIELANSLNCDYDIMRAWLIPCLLETLKNNKHHEYPQNIYEIGTIFKKSDKTETGADEADRVCVTLCGPDADFTRIKQVFDIIMDGLDLHFKTDYTIAEEDHPSFIPGRVGRISVHGKSVAYVGEIHPQVLENFTLDMPVAALELNLTDLYEVINNIKE